jgi:hypothetical protein
MGSYENNLNIIQVNFYQIFVLNLSYYNIIIIFIYEKLLLINFNKK